MDTIERLAGITREQYLAIAKRYEENDDIRNMVAFTYYGAKAIYYTKGFVRGVTVGLLTAVIIAAVVYFI